MIKKIIGIFLIVVGLLALVTPFTPGSWLVFIGLNFLGVKILLWHKIKPWLSARGIRFDSGGQKNSAGQNQAEKN